MHAEAFERFLEQEGLRQKKCGTLSLDEERFKQQKPMLLVADEDAKYIEQVRETFSEPFQILVAADSEAALSLVSKHNNGIALVLLSQCLPGDGPYRVLDLIRQDRNLWKMPVILTGPADKELEKKALLSGAADYAYKPHCQESLAKRVFHAIQLNTARVREETLREEAYRDQMTGALNRRGWQATVASLHKGDAPMAVCFFDLDNLKKINDIYGHGEGDRLIIAFSNVLRDNIRGTDIMARLGGDEFIVIMKRIRSPEIALQKCEEICRAFHEAPVIHGMSATASAGIVMWHAECAVDEIFEQVDAALYQAKTTHSGQCVML